MSFLIDDILKKNTYQLKYPSDHSYVESVYGKKIVLTENSYQQKCYTSNTVWNNEPNFSTFALWPYGRFNPLRLCLVNNSKIQVRFSQKQSELLEDRFRIQKYLNPEERRALAGDLNLTDRQVKTWFQNRRAKWRRMLHLAEEDKETFKNLDEKNLNDQIDDN